MTHHAMTATVEKSCRMNEFGPVNERKNGSEGGCLKEGWSKEGTVSLATLGNMQVGSWC